jgi:hypothetical protein
MTTELGCFLSETAFFFAADFKNAGFICMHKASLC